MVYCDACSIHKMLPAGHVGSNICRSGDYGTCPLFKDCMERMKVLAEPDVVSSGAPRALGQGGPR